MRETGLQAGEASVAAPELGPNGYASAVLEVLINPVLVVDSALAVLYANPAAEQFFQSSAGMLRRQKLPALVPATSPIVPLVRQVQAGGNTTSEYEVDLGTPKTGPRLAHITVAAMMDRPGEVVLTLQETTMASKMDRQLLHRNAARSVTGMASVLAHEVKNPLAGIRGAAQLLETAASEDDRALTQLICDETDRIVAMVERMEMFSDHGLKRDPINIHEVLERVRRIAGVGFASNVRILEDYDPSLPSVPGDFDQLVQVFLNLLKNAAEAVAPNGGEIVVHTAFRHGVRLEVPGTDSRQKLPLEVIIQDNGPGVPEDILPYIFDPFITTKSRGTGLGLPLVAKIIGDHGGIVECDTTPQRTVFRVLLPMSEETKVSRK